MSKRPRVSYYFASEDDKTSISQRMEAVRDRLSSRLGAVTYSDVFEEILGHYERSLDSRSEDSSQTASDHRQIMVNNPDQGGQLHICEEQQLRLLVQEVTRRCPTCNTVAWKMEDSIMKGHVICADVVCMAPGCKNKRRWLSSSILGDRFAVNARYVYLYVHAVFFCSLSNTGWVILTALLQDGTCIHHGWCTATAVQKHEQGC